MDNTHTAARNWFSGCLIALLATTFTVNLISALIRLDEAGVGCEPWPHCYAQVGRYLHQEPPSAVETVAPTAAVKRAHRSLATVLVVLVLAIVAQARRQPLAGFARSLPYAMVFVVLLLAVVGPASYLKTLPAVATLNLIGGVLLLSLTWLLYIRVFMEPLPVAPTIGRAAWASLVVLAVQLLLGVWVSANFAATACSGLLDCMTDGSGPQSFWYLRELSLDASGHVVQNGAQGLIQWTHHLWAIVTTAVLVYLAWLAVRAGSRARIWGMALFCLLVLQLLLGWSGLTWPMPLWLVLTHNLVASLLLLTVLRLLVPPAQPVGTMRTTP